MLSLPDIILHLLILIEIKHLNAIRRVGTIIYFDISVSQGMKDTYLMTFLTKSIKKRNQMTVLQTLSLSKLVTINTHPFLSNIYQ